MTMTGYKSVNFADLCRLCANSAGVRVGIFTEEGRIRKIQSKINESLGLNVQETDRLPKSVCTLCLKQVEAHTEFRELVGEKQGMLESCLSSSAKNGGKVYIRVEKAKEPQIVSRPASSFAQIVTSVPANVVSKSTQVETTPVKKQRIIQLVQSPQNLSPPKTTPVSQAVTTEATYILGGSPSYVASNSNSGGIYTSTPISAGQRLITLQDLKLISSGAGSNNSNTSSSNIANNNNSNAINNNGGQRLMSIVTKSDPDGMESSGMVNSVSVTPMAPQNAVPQNAVQYVQMKVETGPGGMIRLTPTQPLPPNQQLTISPQLLQQFGMQTLTNMQTTAGSGGQTVMAPMTILNTVGQPTTTLMQSQTLAQPGQTVEANFVTLVGKPSAQPQSQVIPNVNGQVTAVVTSPPPLHHQQPVPPPQPQQQPEVVQQPPQPQQPQEHKQAIKQTQTPPRPLPTASAHTKSVKMVTRTLGGQRKSVPTQTSLPKQMRPNAPGTKPPAVSGNTSNNAAGGSNGPRIKSAGNAGARSSSVTTGSRPSGNASATGTSASLNTSNEDGTIPSSVQSQSAGGVATNVQTITTANGATLANLGGGRATIINSVDGNTMVTLPQRFIIESSQLIASSRPS
ncbi:AGAP006758-PA-like protein [Anopheles sinensis]|uniref:AGAP006758-PA-like protein n=1 Tax=Anopheles sinensis TaxID=74873 RepID=A0A084WLC0_ANOSI|nr:AGAP006758-PA-like protein [Anopheles sinensis]